jgi:ABC-type polysaccharide/polyol phosphate export permease
MTARSEVPTSFRSSAVRPGPLASIRLGITETLSRRRLIAYLVRADLKKSGADTLLGNIWWVVDPLLQMLVYYVFVGVILQRGGATAFPLFIFAAILPWKWFDTTVKDGILSVVGQERLIKQIYFPKLVLPLATSMSGVVNFAFGLIPLVLLMVLLYPDRLTPWMLLLPVVAAVQLVFASALAILLSAVNVFYRDVGNLARHVIRFWFYLSPALYGLDEARKIAGNHRVAEAWFTLNPWSHLFTSYRNLIYAGTAPDWVGLGGVLAASLVLLAVAVLVFKRVEPSFAKVL